MTVGTRALSVTIGGAPARARAATRVFRGRAFERTHPRVEAASPSPVRPKRAERGRAFEVAPSRRPGARRRAPPPRGRRGRLRLARPRRPALPSARAVARAPSERRRSPGSSRSSRASTGATSSSSCPSSTTPSSGRPSSTAARTARSSRASRTPSPRRRTSSAAARPRTRGTGGRGLTARAGRAAVPCADDVAGSTWRRLGAANGTHTRQHVVQHQINIRPRLLEPFVMDMRDSQPANLGP